MPLKPSHKNCKKPLNLLAGFGLAVLLSACATTISTNEIEQSCAVQTSSFVLYADCIVDTYQKIPADQRAGYEDLDIYFVDQAALLSQRVRNGEISEVEARAELSRIRMEIQSERQDRNYQYDRSHFDVGVGVGSHSGYWGGYRF